MTHFGKCRERCRAHPLGWRICGQQLGVFLFKLLQFAEQAVVFGIADRRLVEHVIAVIVLLKACAQLASARKNRRRNRHSGKQAQRARATGRNASRLHFGEDAFKLFADRGDRAV